ncbi:protein-disulfide reductase DsbD domain-containing protein [Roseibacillus ishigakijimensis]|uniref:Thiol:disulfide interchange protein DsbD N-terminal domain-containing protein n=1 Tax=Roseibacillus ishigakijimensis TaxID=454146 RepID=A0A934RMM0_9BACT|nr:protein-disulfide reductase DsbD domain-containing protein [Roseibacillus ishigakijimensis]MBK1834179.1 hypothetical protein [Roseibacillus ishigakijimensis]
MTGKLTATLSVAATLPLAAADGGASARIIAHEAGASESEHWFAVEVTPDPGYHVYYKNPGEMGLPVKLKLENLPEGVTVGDLHYPAPHRMLTGELATFGYEEPTRFLFPVTFADKDQLPDEPVEAVVTWLSCNDGQCLPGKVSLSLNFSEPERVDLSPEIAALPQDGSESWQPELSAIEGDWQLKLQIPAESKIPAEAHWDLFSETADFIDPATEPTFTREEDQLVVTVPQAEYVDTLDSEVPVVLHLTGPQPAVKLTLSQKNDESGE